jgi:adenosine 3'-phospho 5'-phosphosulfate transporter B2
MKHQYGTAESGMEYFTETQFLVFANRVLALVAAIVLCKVAVQPAHRTPLYKYSYVSLSNVMSSWFQWEALKYVSFSTQVLAKACKVIPVLLMGKLVNGKTYPPWEYGCALALAVGVGIFMQAKAADSSNMVEVNGTESSSSSTVRVERVTSMAGVVLMAGYMLLDSFTTNFQSALFKAYKPTKYQMMFGVNLISCFFCLWSLLLRGQLLPAVGFVSRHPLFMGHAAVLSLTSATGQIFLFHMIGTYG